MPVNQNRNMLDVVRILEVCRDIELHCAELYHYYAEIFSDVAEVSSLWKKTAMEEENHASQFVMAINLRKQNVVDAVKIDLYLAENTLNAIKAVYAGVRRSNPNLIDALRSAIKLEQKLEKFHLSSVALFQEESFKGLFEAMMKSDQLHVEKLEAAYKTALAMKN